MRPVMRRGHRERLKDGVTHGTPETGDFHQLARAE
jgi:hypothetical protein